jgi:hypothetical protein
LLEDKDITRTFFVIDENLFLKNQEILAYFSISLKELYFSKDVSNSKIKKIDGITKNRDFIIGYLIAQLGKNDKYKNDITGKKF